jgi:hypothetical protein
MQTIGQATVKDSMMADVMKHDFLKKSLEQRVQRKALYNEFASNLKLASTGNGLR